MSGAPAGYEEIAAPPDSPHVQAGGPPSGYEEVAAPNWAYSQQFVENHPVLTNVLKSFDIANVGKNVASGAAGVVKGAYDVGKDLVNNPNWVMGPDSTYEKFVGAPAAAQAQQASQLWQQGGVGNRVEAAGHELAGALPVLGPYAASLGQQAGTGDVGGAVGQGIGATLGGKAVAAVPAIPGKLKEAVPSYNRAGQGLGAMDKAYADLPIKPLRSYTAANELVNKLERTGQSVPGPLRAFVERNAVADIAQAHPEVVAQLQEQGIGTHNPLTFPEAREFRTVLNSLKYDQAYSPLRAQIGHIAGELDADIRASAPHPQFLQDYNRFNKEYNKASATQRVADKVGGAVGGAAGSIAGYEAGRLTGIPHLPWVGGGVGYTLGKPVVGGMVSRVLERPMGTPDLTPPKLPASKLPREAYTRIMLDAKEGNISPTRLDQLGVPKMRRIPQPPEEP